MRRAPVTFRMHGDPPDCPGRRPQSRFRDALRISGLIGLVVLTALPLAAEVRRLTILHTNDVHDRVRPGREGVGGIAYVSGYIRAARAKEPALLVLDAGDVTEKGDLVAFRTHSLITYEAFRRIGYDAVTIGNHDHDAGDEWLRRYESAMGRPLICLNTVDGAGAPRFESSRLIRRAGMTIAVIGMLVPQDAGTLDFEASGRRLAVEAERLDREATLVIALCHAGSDDCAAWSRMAPAVDLFVSGHTHERLDTPRIVPETGVPIVQAGHYGEDVGQLELEVDTATERIVAIHGRLVPMHHATVPQDHELAARIADRERELCPDAGRIIARASMPIGPEIAWLAAEASRQAAGADIGFCNPGHVIRDGIPPGPVNVNSIFLTGGQRGHDMVTANLTGAEISAYLAALEANPEEQTAWAGFACRVMEGSGRRRAFEPELGPEASYRIVMPRIEWEKRFLRAASRLQKSEPASPLARGTFDAVPSTVTFFDSLVAMLDRTAESERDLSSLIKQARTAAMETTRP